MMKDEFFQLMRQKNIIPHYFSGQTRHFLHNCELTPWIAEKYSSAMDILFMFLLQVQKVYEYAQVDYSNVDNLGRNRQLPSLIKSKCCRTFNYILNFIHL